MGVDPEGQPAKNCHVFAFQGYIGACENTQTDERGEFSLGPLSEGNWTLEAGKGMGPYAESESIEVDAGRTGIVLQLRAGGSFAGEVPDARSGERCECELSVSSADSESWLGTASRSEPATTPWPTPATTVSSTISSARASCPCSRRCSATIDG